MATEWDELSALAQKYAGDGWLINHGVFGGFDAYWGQLAGSPLILHDHTVHGLDARVAEFIRVWDASPGLPAGERRAAAEAAAKRLDS